MIEFLRSLFGISDVTGNRTVVGGVVNVDVRHVQYIKNSNSRLTALQQLYNRYKGSPHESKVKEVYEKTKKIHSYLVFKKKLHELELFHLQNTDHFLNTFTVILDVHQKHAPATTTPSAVESESFFRNFKTATATLANKTRTVSATVKPVSSPVTVATPPRPENEVPTVTFPDIFIDSSSRIRYTLDGVTTGPATREIGFTATNEEREIFLAQVSVRLGINRLDISYVGNALLTLPSDSGAIHKSYVPILHWRGSAYALNLQDYRIFPVKLYRRMPKIPA